MELCVGKKIYIFNYNLCDTFDFIYFKKIISFILKLRMMSNGQKI